MPSTPHLELFLLPVQGGADLPVHEPSAPGVAADKNEQNGGVGYVLIPDLPPDILRPEALVDVSVFDRTVYDVRRHLFDQQVLVLLVVLVMVADEHLMPWLSWHLHPPSVRAPLRPSANRPAYC